ncbi:acetyl-CoA carboxylase biotin carboxylase subunit [Acidobacteriota bacterium]
MFKKILIANRGEIALRIIRTAKEMGIKTVAIYSESDKDCLHTMLADEKICIGPGRPSESYLNIPVVMAAAEVTNADAIHPGYGFLAENPRLPEICESAGITFIGPAASIMRLMGDKNRARQEMIKAKLPVIPGSDKIIKDMVEAKIMAKKIGYPVILKASAGGGGKGMRIVRSESQIEDAFNIAQAEAVASFGTGSLYMEKFLEIARHIEIQVAGDKKNNVKAFGERECSVQRKHQKLIEETPSPYIDEKLRKRIVKVAEDAAAHIGYQSLGTFEFLVDENKNYYFMEANTRVQVEHPITEMVYDIDLIKEQINIAAGYKLSFGRDMEMRGHSIECRINAEDPVTFIPSPGKIDFLILPGGQGIRVETAAYTGWNIPPEYDSLIAKIITHAPTRQDAIQKMLMALDTTTIVGIKTNIPLQIDILSNSDFQKGEYDIRFMDKYLADKKSKKM